MVLHIILVDENLVVSRLLGILCYSLEKKESQRVVG